MKSYEKGKLPYIIFGSGTAIQIGKHLENYEIKKCLIISGSTIIKHEVTKRVMAELEKIGIEYEVYAEVLPDPSDSVCIKIANKIKKEEYDCVIGIGGGSPMDVAKASSLIAGIPENIDDLHDYGKSGSLMKEKWMRPCMLVLIPTTSGTGAETTATAVISSERHHLKFSFGNRNTIADLCIIDPEFTIGMPAAQTAYGGADTLAHIIEILVGTSSNEYTDTILLECLEKVWRWLPIALKEPSNKKAREQLSWSAHNALANGGIPNGHAVAHAMGSSYHLIHGHACIIVLPTVIRHFAETSQNAIQKIAKKIGVAITGDAKKDANSVADAILAYYKNIGMKPFQETILEKGYHDDKQMFIKKMIPAILDDFKSKHWLPPIHTDNYEEKIGKICEMIYDEK